MLPSYAHTSHNTHSSWGWLYNNMKPRSSSSSSLSACKCKSVSALLSVAWILCMISALCIHTTWAFGIGITPSLCYGNIHGCSYRYRYGTISCTRKPIYTRKGGSIHLAGFEPKANKKTLLYSNSNRNRNIDIDIGIDIDSQQQKRKRQKGRIRTGTGTASDREIDIDPEFLDNAKLQLQLHRKPKQKRRKPKYPKRPPSFWSNMTNLDDELRSFWASVHVGPEIIKPTSPPPIPNETLLNFFERHDLRYAIAHNGGRNVTSIKLGGAKLIPGKWSQAIQQSEEVQCLMRPDNPAGKGLTKQYPPIARHKKKMLVRGEVKRVKKMMHNDIMDSFLLNGDGEFDEISGISENSDSLTDLDDDRSSENPSTRIESNSDDNDEENRNIAEQIMKEDEVICFTGDQDTRKRAREDECVLDGYVHTPKLNKSESNPTIVNSISIDASTSTTSIHESERKCITRSSGSNKVFPEIIINESIMKGEDGMLEIAKMNEDTIRTLRYPAGERWAQNENRKPRGYWNQDVLVAELYDYLAYVKDAKGRPSIWMPQPSEISGRGRIDLRQAISRFGGTDYICGISGLVPYKEWLYFETQLELFVELQGYLNKYGDGDGYGDTDASDNTSKSTRMAKHDGGRGGEKVVFPKLSDIRRNGHDRLHDLVMDFGGRKMTAIRLDMAYQKQTKVDIFRGMSFGIFDIKFGIRLLHFMRNEMMECDPFYENYNGDVRSKSTSTTTQSIISESGHIQMPTIKTLIQKGQVELAKEVKKHGGHEALARRLQLSFDPKEAWQDAKDSSLLE